MRAVILQRFSSSDQGTFGRLWVDGKPFSFTGEPPWRDNQPNRSCIPPGMYDCVWHRSPKYGWCYMVTGVDGRAWILAHPGNYCGDQTKGYRTHTLGCILLGKFKGFLGNQRAVLASRPTVRRFNGRMGGKPFKLFIV